MAAVPVWRVDAAALRRLWHYCRGFRPSLLLVLLLTVLAAAFRPLLAALVEPAADEISLTKHLNILWLIVLGVMAGFLAHALLRAVASCVTEWVGGHVIMRLRGELFEKSQYLPMRFFDTWSSGELSSRIINDPQQARMFGTYVVDILREGITIVALTGWMFYKSPQLALLVLLIAPLLLIVLPALRKWARRAVRKTQEAYSSLMVLIDESWGARKLLRIYARSRHKMDSFATISNKQRHYSLRSIMVAESISSMFVLITMIPVAMICLIATRQVYQAELSVSELLSFFAAVGLLRQPVTHLMRRFQALQGMMESVSRIFRVLDRDTEQDKGTLAVTTIHGDIEFRGVTFGYDEDRAPVFDHLDLHIPARTRVALVGPSGSGKSTLTSLICRFYPPRAGSILLDGVPLQDYTLDCLRGHIALVTQEVFLMNDTVSNNITLGDDRYPQEQIEAAAKAAYVIEFTRHLPQGLDTLVGENGVQLSGGQRQRIAIARAMLKDAPILILDEATSALDTASEHYVQRALEHVARHRTCLIIAHRLSTIERADRIIVLQAGKVIETGTHGELQARGGAYAALHRGWLEQP